VRAPPPLRPSRLGFTALGLLLPFLASCGDSPSAGGPGDVSGLECTIPLRLVADGGVGRDGIPALTQPAMVTAADPGAGYLRPRDRVIGLLLDGQPIAVPHNILWWHEIVNLNGSEARVAVTYCPLTGSSMVFDRSVIDGAELGVSGLLYQANLIMYDRRSRDSLWPQMMAAAACGPATSTELPMFPSSEMTWEAWQALHPETVVVSGELGMGRNYRNYPYGQYEDLANRTFLRFPVPEMDQRLPPKQRVLGVPFDREGGMAFSLQRLELLGEVAVVTIPGAEGEVAVFWSDFAAGAVAFRAVLDGTPLTFHSDGERILDRETGSEWDLAGRAVDGPLQGARLDPIPDAYVAFWGPWWAFRPQTDLWVASSGGT